MVTTATYSSCDNGRQWLSIEYGLQHTEKRRYSRASLVHPPLMQQQQEQPLPPPPASMLIMAQCQPSQTLANPSLIESSSKRNTQLGHPLKSFTVPAPPPQSAPPVKIVSPNSSNGHWKSSAVVNRPIPPSAYDFGCSCGYLLLTTSTS